MPTRISAGVQVTTLVFLLFIYMIPIDCKITKFSLYLFVSFLKDYHNYFLARAQLFNQWKTRQPVRFVFTHFQPITQCYKQRTTQKYPYNQSSHNRKYTECSIVKAHASFINFKVGWSWLRFASSCTGQCSKQRMTLKRPCWLSTYPSLAPKP